MLKLITKMILEGKTYMPVKDYAELRNCSVQHIYQEIKRGNLNTKKIGNYTLVEK